MTVTKTRKIQKMNKTYFITIPKAWVEFLKVDRGDPVQLSFDGKKIVISKTQEK